MSTLYVIATPIGNLSDMTTRAAETLRAVAVVFAEDTRVTQKLLVHIGARPRLIGYHEDSPKRRLEEALAVLDEGDAALVTDAGTPGLSDPGAEIVREAAARGHTVVPVPGPSAAAALLSVSGLPGGRFLFLGFLPRTQSERTKLLRSAAQETGTVVCFEAPHRLRDALEDLGQVFGGRRIVIGRELTKLYEEIFRGTAEQALLHFAEPRGEFVIAIEGAPERTAEAGDEEVSATLIRLRGEGLSGRTLVEQAAAETGAARSRVYRLSLKPADQKPTDGRTG
ncbi:MAG: 16S rRNA (cytidine(1402)-2'-O)-methyltransferase [Dehalococcoidia bacterium]|nr:16S rRNA (cytidine(1402)-2'-O)-methyltransferase [Dehalococcoidia bacterium]MSQ35168.1 16S rRNA (cytidine(1402)-2'-O)-methyltransferase [Dehalococcoidia bacterium]